MQNTAQITSENGLGNTEGNVRANIEKSSAEFLHCHGINVHSKCERGKTRHPCLEVGLHSMEQLVQILLIKAPKIIKGVEIPAQPKLTLSHPKLTLTQHITTSSALHNQGPLPM